MENNFKIKYSEHERAARNLLLKKNHKTEAELAVMTSVEVEIAIEEKYVVIQMEDDWLLIPKDKYPEFQEIAEWIDR